MLMTEKEVQDLVSSRASEGQNLEFKRELPGKDAGGKHEFLKDVSAMANASGGTIIFGISEEDGQAAALIAIRDESADQAITRLEQSLQSSVEPRIYGTLFAEIRLAGGGYVIQLIVPRSFSGPHRVTLNNKNAFYVRVQRHVSEFSYSQIRDAFTMRDRAEDRMHAWRSERLTMIKGGNTPRPLRGRARYVIHLLPLLSFSGSTAVDVRSLRRKGNALLFGRMTGYSDYLNLDGVVAASHIDRTEDQKYVQLFRNGCLETVGFAGLLLDDRKIIPAEHIAHEFRAALKAQLPTLVGLGISGPLAVGVSWLSIGDHALGIGDYEKAGSDRDDLQLPEVWVDSVEDIANVSDGVARPVLDLLWQCFDIESCPYFDATGSWTLN